MAKLIKDDRLSGDNRLLAQFTAMWLDSLPSKKQNLTPEEWKECERQALLFQSVIMSRFVNKRGDIMNNIDRSDTEAPIADIEREATAIERAAIDAIVGRV